MTSDAYRLLKTYILNKLNDCNVYVCIESFFLISQHIYGSDCKFNVHRVCREKFRQFFPFERTSFHCLMTKNVSQFSIGKNQSEHLFNFVELANENIGFNNKIRIRSNTLN